MERPSSTTVLSGNNKMNTIYIRPGIINSSDQQQNQIRTNAVDDSAEISIFDAEKYFNELNVLEAPKLGSNKVSPAENIAGGGRIIVAESDRFSSASSSVADGGYSSVFRNYRTRSFRSAATPTASSEASWNSQTGLLSVQPGSMSVSLRSNLGPEETTKKKKKKKNESGGRSLSPSPTSPPASFRWLSLRKKCPCSCKKSVQVKEKISLPKPSPPEITLLSPSPPPPPILTAARPPPPPIVDTCNNAEKVRHESFQENWYRTRNNNNNEVQATGSGIRTSFANSAFSFPILKAKSPASPTGKDPARDSLEIFRPTSSSSSTLLQDIASRRNSEILPRPDQTRPFALNSGDSIDDGASDASSDLFEIESFSTATTATTTTTTAASAAMFLYRRDSLEVGAGGGRIRCGRTFGDPQRRRRESLEEEEEEDEEETECCYEPSEASIDWSVTTAEGFDRASVAYTADFSEFSEAAPAREKTRRKSSGTGLLMSCRCEKAVNVGRPVPVPRPTKPKLSA